MYRRRRANVHSMTDTLPMPKPGDRVACRTRMRPVEEGATGCVVRLIHSTIEGAVPFEDERMGAMIVYVRWDDDPKIHPVRLDLLRVTTAPIDLEVLQIVAQLKRSLSIRNMRYVIEQLSAELANSSRP